MCWIGPETLLLVPCLLFFFRSGSPPELGFQFPGGQAHVVMVGMLSSAGSGAVTKQLFTVVSE